MKSGNSMYIMRHEGSLPVQRSLLFVPVLSEINPVHVVSTDFNISLILHYHAPHRFSKWAISQNSVCASPLPHTCHIPWPSQSLCFDHPKNTGWWVYVVRFLIVQFPPGPCSLLTLRPKYSPQHIHSQTVVAEVFPIMWENTFHTQQDAKL